jgi:hypothetical protein
VNRILAATLLLALLTGNAGAQVPQPANVAVEALALSGAPPQWVGTAPTPGEVRVTVGNRGATPVAYRIDVEWVTDAGAMPLNGDPALSFDVSRQPLGPGEQRTHPVPWTLQPGQEGAGVLRAVVQVTEGADSSPGDNQRTLPVFVAVRRLSAHMDENDLALEPGSTGFFRLQLRNEGNRQESVALRLSGRAGDGRLTGSLSDALLVVDPASARNAHLLVSFRPDGDFSPARANFTVEVAPGFGQNLTLRSPDAHGTEGDGDLAGFAFGLAASGPGPWHVPADAPMDLQLRLHNTGTRADNYTVRLEAAPGWSVSAAPSAACLRPGEAAAIAVRVQAPAGAPAGSSAVLRVSAKGSLAPTVRAVDAQVVVGGPSPHVDDVALDAVPYAGQPVAVRARLVNQGDQAQPATEAAILWNMTGTVKEARGAVPLLPPGASHVLLADLPAPTLGGPIEVEVRWPANAQSGVTVGSFVHKAVLVLEAPSPLSGSPGETVPYRLPPHAFRITNQGNADEVVHLEAYGRGGVATLDQAPLLSLERGESRIVRAKIQLPNPAGDLANATLGLVAAIEGAPFEWRSEVETAIVDTEPPLLLSPTLPSLWTLGVPLTVELDVHDQAPLASVVANVTLPSGARRLLPLHPSAGHWNTTLTFEQPGNHSVRFVAIDLAGNNITSPARHVRAALVDPPRLHWTRADRTQVEPDAVIGLRIEDAQPLHPVEITVLQGTHVDRFLVPVRNGTSEFHLDAPGPGNATVTARATNWAGASTVSELTLQVTKAPLSPLSADDDAKRAEQAPGFAFGIALAALALAVAAAWRRP